MFHRTQQFSKSTWCAEGRRLFLSVCDNPDLKYATCSSTHTYANTWCKQHTNSRNNCAITVLKYAAWFSFQRVCTKIQTLHYILNFLLKVQTHNNFSLLLCKQSKTLSLSQKHHSKYDCLESKGEYRRNSSFSVILPITVDSCAQKTHTQEQFYSWLLVCVDTLLKAVD